MILIIISKQEKKELMDQFTKFVPMISSSIEEFRKSIDPIRKIIINSGYISGKKPGLEDYIFLEILSGFMFVAHVTC